VCRYHADARATLAPTPDLIPAMPAAENALHRACDDTAMPCDDRPPRARIVHARTRAFRRLLLLQTIATAGFFVTSCQGGVPTTGTDLSSGETIMQLTAAVLELRQDNAMLQDQIDSLRMNLAYQDTVLRQLANLSNVSMRPPTPSVP